MSKKIHDLLDSLFNALNDYSIGNEPYSTTLARLKPHSKTIQKHFITWASDVAELIETVDHHRAAPILIAAVALLTRRTGALFTDEFLPYLMLAPMTAHYVPIEDTMEIFNDAGLTQGQVVEVIEFSFEHDDDDFDAVMCLIPMVTDLITFNRLVRDALELANAKSLANSLGAAADRAFDVVRTLQKEGDDSRFMTQVALRLGNQCATIPDGPFYIDALAHKSNMFRELAQLGISSKGASARTLLEQGAKSRKKVVREWCKTQLDVIGDERVDECVDEHTGHLNAFDALEQDEQRQMLGYIKKLDSLQPRTWDKWVKQKVSERPLAWLYAALHLFDDNHDLPHVWRVLTTILTHKETSIVHQELWGVYLSHLARAPTIKSAHTQRQLKEHFRLIPQSFEQEVLEQALLGASAPMTTHMIEHYFAVHLCSPSMLALSVQHKSKKIRDAAVSSSLCWFSIDDVSTLVPLLSARKKQTRLYTAKALLNVSSEYLEQYHDVFSELMEKEQYEDVREVMSAVCTLATPQ